MKTKKRLTGIFIALLVLLLMAGLSAFGIREYRAYTDSRDNQYSLNVSVTSVSSSTGQDSPISFTVSNDSYIPLQIREVMLLSVYDQAGNPVFLDGSPYTESSVELCSEKGTLAKALEGHQAVYVQEYALDAGKPLFEVRSEWEESAGSHLSSEYSLVTAENSPYTGYTLRLDLFLYGRPQAYPYADWQALCSVSNLSESTFTNRLSLPIFSASQAYHWELDSGKALLVDVGNMQDPDAVVPEKIWLTETPDGYVEDPVTGTCYDVKVKGNAFYDNKWLQTVTFRDGASIAGNIMWDGRKQGMFEGCTALTAVNNIPDSVVSMEDTFQRCASLEGMPQLPTMVENLNSCFLGCTALQEVSAIPKSVHSMKACFQGCTSLKTAPVFPEGVTDLSDCFYGCTALETIATLPQSVTVLDRAFTNCSSLTVAPVLPDGLQSMAATFYNCTNLTEVSSLPDTVINLSSCFEQCSNLETVPELPSQAFLLNECFLGCTKLSGSVTLPGNAFVHSEYYLQEENIFGGCEALEIIYVDSCPNAIDSEIISTDIPVRFTKTHTQGTCEGCHMVNDTYDVNGLTVVMDDVPDMLTSALLETMETVPQALIPTCRRITFTPNWSHGNQFAGIYYWDSRTAFIRIYPFHDFFRISKQSALPDVEATLRETYYSYHNSHEGIIIHELAHGYDRYSTSSIISDTYQWRELCAQEGSQYNPPAEHYAPSEYREEIFARTVAQYFTEPETLQVNAPNIYAYLDSLFGDAA